MKRNYDNYDLFEATDNHLTRPKIRFPREKRFYPSEASVQIIDEHGDTVTHGNCLRASYFRLAGNFQGQPFDAHTMHIFGMGNKVEEMLIETWKEMGIWVDNNIKWISKEHNISGEIDAILAEPPNGQLYGVEVKSFYGYFAEKELFGDRRTYGFPKMGQLLQTLLYTYFHRETLPYFRMVYFGRDSVKRTTFKIELLQEGDIFYPVVDGEVIRSFTINDILERYHQLSEHLERNTIPPGDYQLQFNDAKIEDFRPVNLGGKGKIAKTKYEKWKTGKLKANEIIGDWQCSYCKYKSECWG